MNRRDYDYLISCAARVEADARVGKTSFSNTSDKCLINALICGALWFFIHSNIIFSNNTKIHTFLFTPCSSGFPFCLINNPRCLIVFASA